MNVSAEGYVVDAGGSIDFTEPSEDVFSYWIGVQRAAVLDVYGRALYETMRYWEPPSAEASDADRAFADAWQRTPKSWSRRRWSPSSRTRGWSGPGARR